MSDQLLTVNPAALHELLSDVARTSGTDFTLPMLNGLLLQVESHEGNTVLVGTSTNRFVMGQAHIGATGEMPPTFLALDRVKQLLGILKPYEKCRDMLCEVTRDGDNFTLKLPGDLVLPAVSVSVPVSDNDRDFPKCAQMLKSPTDLEPGVPLAFNPRYMALFCAIAKGRNDNLRVIPGKPDRPQLVLIGEWYRALIMPVHSNEKVDTPVFLTPREKESVVAAAAAANVDTGAPKASGEAA